MSEITLSRARRQSSAHIVVGYDPPFDFFFLLVEWHGQPSFADAVGDLGALVDAAVKHGIVLHDTVIQQLQRDRQEHSTLVRDWSGDWAQRIGPRDRVVRVLERVVEPLAA